MNKITLGFFLAKSKTTIKRLLVLFALLFINTQTSWGQENYVSWNFTTALSSGSYDASQANMDGVRTTALTAPTLTGVTITGASSANNSTTLHRTTTWNNNTASVTASAAKYVEFTITLAPGQTFPNSSLTLNMTVGASNATTAPNRVHPIYGYGNSPTFVLIGSALSLSTSQVAQTAITVPAPGNSTTSKLTIRLAAYSIGSTTQTGNFRISSIALTAASLPVVGSASPTLTADATSNTVDNPIDITFTDDSVWRGLAVVKIGTSTLASGTDYDLTVGNLQLKPSGLNTLLTTSGSKAITIVASGYTDATVTQVINAGVPTANSTATISAALAPNTSRTITSTAKDQYNNLVSGYTFGYDVTITNNNSTTAESYTIDGSPFTATSTSGNPVSATTNASGVATFNAVLPATIDGSDGISIQTQLNNDTINIGSAFSFTQLASQTITFDALTPVTYGDTTFGLTATASSTLPVSYESSNTAVATISGSTVTIVGAGSTNITASQSGNGSFNAAANVIQALTVNAKALTLPDAVATSRAYNTVLTTDIAGTLLGIINSDDVTLVGTLKGTFADANVANGIAVTAACTLAGAKAGNYTLTQPTGLTANITQAGQTITFGALANKIIGAADYSPGATSPTSGTNAITYASSNTAVATIVLGQIHILSVGTTNITASQAGSLNYTAASDVVQSLTVTPAPLAAWQFGSPATLGTEVNYNATTNDTNLNTVVLSRGSGILPTALGRAFAANSWDNLGTKTTAVSTGEYFEFVVNVKSGYKLNLTALDATIRRSGTTAPNAYIWKYSTDGTNFTEIGTDISYTGTTEGVSQPQIDLSAISALQNVENTTSLTFRLYAWGGTSTTSTFSIGRYATSVTTNSLSISGTIEASTSTTWNGSAWSNGTPTASLEAIIDGAYNTNVGGVQVPFTAKKLTVTSLGSLTVNSGNNVTVINEVINNAGATGIVIENNANLIQDPTTVVNANSGAITVKRNSNPLFRLDYTLWSSPVSGTQTLGGFSPLTTVGRFYTYNSGSNQYNVVAPETIFSPTAPFSQAKGYLIRMPNEGSANYNARTETLEYSGVFTGTPNNGTVSVTGLTSETYNAIGNPYPSTLDAALFLSGNNTDGVLYFWRKTNGIANTTSAYATWTTLGAAGSAIAPNNVAPNGTIAVGQGFIVKTGVGATTLNFTNAMRTSSNSALFFKTKKSADKSRIWLNLTNTSGAFSQALVGYIDGATNGFDNGIDGKYINDSSIALTSSINNEEYTIQGRPTFDASDVVALNFKTDVAGDFNIAIDHVDGLFSGSQDIYLVDSKTGTETNLKTNSYSFTAAAEVDNTRFSLRFQKTLKLDASVLNDNSVIVYKNNGVIYVHSGAKTMNNIKVFDIQGRVVAEQKSIKANTTSIQNLKASNQVLIVKVTTDDNQVISKKVEN